MRFLRLTRQQVQIIVEQAKDHAPNEICGLIVGQQGVAKHIIPIPNCSQTPTTHFEMDAQFLPKAYKTIDAIGEELLAVYHSHPNGEPLPSPTDVRDATRNMPNVIQLIVGMKQHKAQFQAWHIHDGQVDKVELLVGDAVSRAMPCLSRAQIIAILLMTLLAAVFLISFSIMLLPPAPPIPTPH